ncbi:MAG: hypothetical protein ACODAG_09355 [Myxococcota bacterium]
MSLGDPILRPAQARRAVVARMDPRAAMARALSAYLAQADFTRWGGGEEGEDVAFRLHQVLDHWPEPDRQLQYPSASVVDPAPAVFEAHNLTPTALEDTMGVWGEGTVLWKIAEAGHTFQVDFWANDEPTIEAISAALPGLFAPEETSSRVRLESESVHYCQTVKAALMDYQRHYAPGPVYAGERRLMARIRCEVDVVELRTASVLSPTALVDVVGRAEED